jgi:hypothetical protein
LASRSARWHSSRRRSRKLFFLSQGGEKYLVVSPSSTRRLRPFWPHPLLTVAPPRCHPPPFPLSPHDLIHSWEPHRSILHFPTPETLTQHMASLAQPWLPYCGRRCYSTSIPSKPEMALGSKFKLDVGALSRSGVKQFTLRVMGCSIDLSLQERGNTIA